MNNDKKRLTRRNFLKSALLAGTGLMFAQKADFLSGNPGPMAQGPTLTPQAYLPQVFKDYSGEPSPTNTSTRGTPTNTPTGTPTNHRVVHVHSTSATFWDFGSNYYGNYVRQDVVNNMVDRGVMELTGTSTVANAWRALLPNYQSGKKIAIKVNFNNYFWCNDGCETNCEEWKLKIDALIHPVNAVIRGLKQIGVDEGDIWVYDATIGSNPPVSVRRIPGRFKNRCLYPGVQFFDYNCNNPAGFNSTDPSAYVTFYPPSGIPTPPSQKITDVLIDATYLINMPIMKKHGGAGVTLSFKNHFGSINNCPVLHDYVYPDGNYYTSTYNPLVDIYRNPHILNKTVLTIGDGLYGDRKSNTNKPTPWSTFGNQAPNSLFFAKDPVALDCVMCDFLHAEGYSGGVRPEADDYLVLAEAAGIGTYERGNPWQEPWGNGYSKIEYVRIEL
ncbi:MAG: DUF362 domain-containing protein [Anaerolineae bacterium]